jgi:hypothetical protein
MDRGNQKQRKWVQGSKGTGHWPGNVQGVVASGPGILGIGPCGPVDDQGGIGGCRTALGDTWGMGGGPG